MWVIWMEYYLDRKRVIYGPFETEEAANEWMMVNIDPEGVAAYSIYKLTKP